MTTGLRNTYQLDMYTMTPPMNGYVFVCSGIRAGQDTRACDVKAIANDETQVKVGEVVLVLEDSMSFFEYKGKSYYRVKTSDIICVLRKQEHKEAVQQDQ